MPPEYRSKTLVFYYKNNVCRDRNAANNLKRNKQNTTPKPTLF